MYIDSLPYKIKTDFQPDTRLALQWFQLSSGNWTATDRGTSADKYDTEIRLYGTESYINDLINTIESNRFSGSNVLALSGFNCQEHIFGADVDYSGTLYATAFMDKRSQKTWKGFEQTMKLSLLSPSFVGGLGFLPILRFLDIQYDADVERTINKFESYNRTFSYQEHDSDVGLFSGTFLFTDIEMIGIRRYIATQRKTTISVPDIYGVLNPFGERTTSYPIDVKIIEFQDLGIYNVVGQTTRWRAKITMAEDI